MDIRYTEEGVRLYRCLTCMDAGWVYARKEDGQPDYSQTVRCQCKQQVEVKKELFPKR